MIHLQKEIKRILMLYDLYLKNVKQYVLEKIIHMSMQKKISVIVIFIYIQMLCLVGMTI